MPSAFEIESTNTPPGSLSIFSVGLLPLANSSLIPIVGGTVGAPDWPPVVRAVDEEADEDDDASEPEIVVPPTEPLETASDFDEDDFDDDFDDDFEEEFEDDEFDSEVTPEDLEASDDSADPFEDE